MSMGVASIVSSELMGLLRADDQDRDLEARMVAVPSGGTRGEVVLPSVLSSSAGATPSAGEVSHWIETGPFSELTELAREVVFPVSGAETSNNLQETELATIHKLYTKCHLGAVSEHHSDTSVAVKPPQNATITASTCTAASPQASNRPGAEPSAVEWYLKAAKQGFVKAYFWLGVMYIDGVGVAKDEASAMEWFMKAAEQGNDSSAQFNVGIMYMNGNGVTKDDASAVKWFLKAAEQGHTKAQSNVAYFARIGLRRSTLGTMGVLDGAI
jgi:hypothetical protein